MTAKKELQLMLIIAGVFLIVGAVCYAAFPVQAPETPVRIMFDGGLTGKVLFDHKQHAGESGYGIACLDCHHHPPEEHENPSACRSCHLTKKDSDELSPDCIDCHLKEGHEGSEAKSELTFEDIEDTEVAIRKDAYHDQCGGCHQEFENGPLKEACFSCHLSKVK